MKRFLLLSFVTFFSSTIIYSQNVRYKVKKDDPSDFKNFIIHLDPSYMDMYFTNLTLGWAVRADWMPVKFFDASFQLRRPYFDMNYMSLYKEKRDSSKFYPVKDFAKMTYMEVTGELHFADKIKNTSHKVVLSQTSSTSGNVKTTRSTFINVPGTVRKIKSLRGGVIWTNTAVEYDGIASGDKIADFTFVEKDNEKNIKSTKSADGGTMMRSMIMYAGLSAQTVSNFKVLTDKYGVKYNTAWNNVYLDVMFAPVLNFAPVDSGGIEYKVENANMKRTGWKFGYVVRSHKGPTWSMAMTFGQRPGFVGNGGFIGARSFLDFNFGISLPYRVSLKPKKK